MKPRDPRYLPPALTALVLALLVLLGAMGVRVP